MSVQELHQRTGTSASYIIRECRDGSLRSGSHQKCAGAPWEIERSRTRSNVTTERRMVRVSDFDAALQREAELYPDRADEIAAERERIKPPLEAELRTVSNG